MNAAVETSRNENQRRRPQSLAHKRSAAGESQVDSSQPLAVLIRLPNLDAPRPAPKATEKAKPENQTPATETTQRTTKAKSPAVVPAPSPAASTTSVLMGWTWRMIILAAAIGLVVLAYRIINGPAAAPTLDTVPESGNVVADGDAKPEASSMPPAPLAPQASEIAAPTSLAPPKVELETPPVQVEPIDVDQQPEYADTGAPADERRPWATDVRMQVPTGEEDYPRTARAERDNGWDRDPRDPRQQPRSLDSNYQPNYQDYSREYQNNWESTGDSEPSFDYPETNPNTWRDEGSWESTPRTAPPRYNGASYDGYAPASGQGAGDWNQPTHSAMRPQEPGVARLQGQIEQPPLRRENERNRPGIY